MLQVWTMGGLSGHGGRTGAYDELLGLLDAAGCTAVVATDCEQEYRRPLGPGDEITFDTVVEEVSGRKTTRLGTGYFGYAATNPAAYFHGRPISSPTTRPPAGSPNRCGCWTAARRPTADRRSSSPPWSGPGTCRSGPP